MPRKPKKTTIVREHSLRVPVSEKNPTGTTVRDRHLRRLKGTYLDAKEIQSVFENYDRKNLVYPAKGKLKQKDSDKYDEIIAVWCDYFNKKFSSDLLDPDVVKALIASESDFRENPRNPKATGIAQITPETFDAIQDPKGEVKEFIFQGVRKKDLKDPSVAIPIAVRWLYRKRRLAEGKLGRQPDAEEMILEYKGLLKSKSPFQEKAIKKFRSEYGKLKGN